MGSSPTVGVEYMKGLFRKMKEHGMEMPWNIDCNQALESVTVTERLSFANPDEVRI